MRILILFKGFREESLHTDYVFQMITGTISLKAIFPMWSNRKEKQLRVWEGG